MDLKSLNRTYFLRVKQQTELNVWTKTIEVVQNSNSKPFSKSAKRETVRPQEDQTQIRNRGQTNRLYQCVLEELTVKISLTYCFIITLVDFSWIILLQVVSLINIIFEIYTFSFP